jgi:hypothetical protein
MEKRAKRHSEGRKINNLQRKEVKYMNHEIVGPEMTVQTGFVRLPKMVAIEKHIAQYSTPSMSSSGPRMESKQDKEDITKANQILFRLEALELTDSNFFDERELRKELTTLGIPDAMTNNWLDRRKVARLHELQKRARQGDCAISIPSLENKDVKTLELEMKAMLKVLNLPDSVERVINEVR